MSQRLERAKNSFDVIPIEEHEEFLDYVLNGIDMEEHGFVIFIDKRDTMNVEELLSQCEDLIKRKESGR